MTDKSKLRQQAIETIASLQALVAELGAEEAQAPETLPAGPAKLCWGAKVSQDFRESVRWIEQQLGLNANYLMACMAFESALTFSPSVRNPNSSATGLIQFMSSTAKSLGTTTAALAKLSAVRQLAYVYYYFKAFGSDLSHWDLADTYMAILLPSMIGKGLDEPMRWSDDAYAVNKGLDANKNGVITKREAAARVEELYKLGMRPENMA